MKRCSVCKKEYPATSEFFHKDSRRVDGLRSECKTCSLAKRKDYRIDKRERVNKTNRDYYQKNKVKINKKRREDYAQNPEPTLQRCRDYYANNKDKVNERNRDYWAKNTPKMTSQKRKYNEKNPLIRKLGVQRRRARRQALPNTFTKEQWEFAVEYWNGRCSYCGTNTDLTIEHFIPLSDPNCPGTVAKNILPVCYFCNYSKNAVDATKWLTRKFGDDAAIQILAQIAEYFASLP